MSEKLRLFIWTDYAPNYTGGLAFAIAKNETDARKQVIKKTGYEPDSWGDLKIKPLTRRTCEVCTGGG